MTGVRIGRKTKKMVEVACSGPNCAQRRVHHERPDTPRGTQYVRIPTHYHGPAFCSISCKLYFDGVQRELEKEKENN